MIDLYESLLKDAANVITKQFLIAKIEKKIENGESLTDEEKDSYLQHLYIKAKESINNYKSSKKPSFSLKIVSMAGKMIGGTTKAYATAIDTTASGIKTNKKNNLELIKGITITSNNMTLENFQVLNEQNKAIDTYIEAFKKYAISFMEKTQSYKQDFTEFGKEEIEAMTTSKAKIKELSKKYKKINSK